MVPPLQHDPSSFTQAAKAACRAAWDVSEVAWTLLDHAAAATSPSIKEALTGALRGCQTELSTVQQEAEQVAYRVKTAAGVWLYTDNGYSIFVDGGDYDTRHARHPMLYNYPGQFYTPQFQTPWLYPPLPGEIPTTGPTESPGGR
ncbi:MAG TPA: hypothetical protein VK611_25740 [Acidimicrobiales bacterium]|nr:hypothetical protein [Acidimicrobiales bacterium]